jgi:hypothetical protein
VIESLLWWLVRRGYFLLRVGAVPPEEAVQAPRKLGAGRQGRPGRLSGSVRRPEASANPPVMAPANPLDPRKQQGGVNCSLAIDDIA